MGQEVMRQQQIAAFREHRSSLPEVRRIVEEARTSSLRGWIEERMHAAFSE
jgi:hypothetical protein